MWQWRVQQQVQYSWKATVAGQATGPVLVTSNMCWAKQLAQYWWHIKLLYQAAGQVLTCNSCWAEQLVQYWWYATVAGSSSWPRTFDTTVAESNNWPSNSQMQQLMGPATDPVLVTRNSCWAVQLAQYWWHATIGWWAEHLAQLLFMEQVIIRTTNPLS